MSGPSAKDIRRIFFAAGGEQGDGPAFERALRLSERAGASLAVVGVAEEPPAGLLRMMASLGVRPDAVGAEPEVRDAVDRLAAAARKRGVEATGEILRGSAGLAIIRKVLREGCDLLIKAPQPAASSGFPLFGHVDRQLIRKCPCPVWIDQPSDARRVLAAVDPAPFREAPGVDREREALNADILEMAALIARIEGADLEVLHAWSFGRERSLQSRAGLEAEAVARLGESVRGEHERALSGLLAPYRSQLNRVHLLKGDPAREMARLTENRPFDVIVMGTVCRTGVAGMLIGNTAEAVLDQVSCSLLTLKPRGFVSPVEA